MTASWQYKHIRHGLRHHQASANTASIMFTINIEDQFDFLLETLGQSEIVNNAINEVMMDHHQAPLDLSVKREHEDFMYPVASPPSRCMSRSSSSSSISSESSSVSSQMSLTESLMEFDTSLLSLSSPPPAHSVTPPVTQEPIMFTVTPVVTRPVVACTNCSTTATSTWRKDKEGRPLCNACGLYLKVHGSARPASWGRQNAIMKRTRTKNKVKRV